MTHVVFSLLCLVFLSTASLGAYDLATIISRNFTEGRNGLDNERMLNFLKNNNIKEPENVASCPNLASFLNAYKNITQERIGETIANLNFWLLECARKHSFHYNPINHSIEDQRLLDKPAVMEVLLQRGANPNHVNEEGLSVLHCAVGIRGDLVYNARKYGNINAYGYPLNLQVQKIALLVKYGADIALQTKSLRQWDNASDNWGGRLEEECDTYTPLQIAQRRMHYWGDLDAQKRFLHDVMNSLAKKLKNDLWIAVYHSDAPSLEALLQKIAEYNLETYTIIDDKTGDTIYHAAALYSTAAFCETLFAQTESCILLRKNNNHETVSDILYSSCDPNKQYLAWAYCPTMLRTSQCIEKTYSYIFGHA